MNQSPIDILIVKIAAIGDVIETLPMLAWLNNAYPAAKVSWVCGRSVAPLLEAIPGIDRLLVVDEARLLAGALPDKIAEVLSLWGKVAGRRFDLVLMCHADARYRVLTLPVLSRQARRLDRSAPRPVPVQGRHRASEYLRLAAGVDGPDAPLPWTAEVTFDLPTSIAEKLNESDNRLIGLAPGGARNVLRDNPLRRWPLQSYAELARRLTARGFRVVITGAESDSWVRESFRHMPGVTDLIGQTTLLELVALYSRCRTVVTHDSGPLHLAGLSRARLIGLFGPTAPEVVMPLRRFPTRALTARHPLACRPCYDGVNYAPCARNECLIGISVDEVEKAVLDLSL